MFFESDTFWIADSSAESRKEPNIDVNTPNGGGDNAIQLAERHCGLESMISCRDSRLF